MTSALIKSFKDSLKCHFDNIISVNYSSDGNNLILGSAGN